MSVDRFDKSRLDESGPDEATLLLQRPPESLILPVLDPRRAQPFWWDRLDRVDPDALRPLELLSSLVPRRTGLQGLQALLASTLTGLLDVPHSIDHCRLGLVLPGQDAQLPTDDGIWTWASFPPSTARVLLGCSWSLAQEWTEALGEDFASQPTPYRAGTTTLLLAELFAVLCDHLGWPPLSWAINPIEQKYLTDLLECAEPPVLELVFYIRARNQRGLLRLWLPAGVVRFLEAFAGQRPMGDPGDETYLSLYGHLTCRRPLIAGSSHLDRRTLSTLHPGDVLILQRHGVAPGEGVALGEEEPPPHALWQLGHQIAINGWIRAGPSGRWAFETHDYQRIQPRGTPMNAEQPAVDLANAVVPESLLEVQVQVGAVSMEIGQLARLRPGQVLDCDRPAGSVVDLVVAGTSVGRGELVVVGDRLGVRILSMR